VPKPRPSKQLRSFIRAYGSVNAAAEAWGIEYRSLDRFVNEGAGLSLATAMQIAAKTKVPVDELFEQPEAKEAKP
jgi:plasmid maintenance system antidote protein VapI